jgi:hypothetical protein
MDINMPHGHRSDKADQEGSTGMVIIAVSINDTDLRESLQKPAPRRSCRKLKPVNDSETIMAMGLSRLLETTQGNAS